MSTGSRLAFVRYNRPLGDYVPDSYKITPYVPVTASVHSVENIPLDPGGGKAWTITTLTANKTITLDRNNPFSQDLRIRFTNNDSLLRSYEGMPASKCDAYVNLFNYISNLATSNITNSPNYTVYVTLAPGFWNGTPIAVNPTTYVFTNPSQHTNLTLATSNNQTGVGLNYRGTHYQTGSEILASTYPNTAAEGYQYPGFSDFDPTVCYANIYISTSKTGTAPYSITFNVNCLPNIDPNSTLRWWGKTYNIDGQDGDTIQPITSNFTLFKDVKMVISGSANISVTSLLQEQSQSVITGVEKTLQNNFTLSATARVEHFATKTLIQQTELLGTVFNFRFMEALATNSDTAVIATAGVIKNLPASLSLSNNFTANFVGNMIYDITIEYTWDDFGIVGYFITGYTVRGYSANQSEYTWQELLDSWDTWTYSTWQGNETGWDQWPEDIWNSTKRLSFDFDFAQVGQIIRGAVSQLMSTTALTENAAFRKEGVPGEIRSDFLCDGSPSGLIGGGSTIVSDAVLTALANYIINNAQNISGAFDATLLANYIVQFLWQAQSDFSLSVTPTFKPSGVTNAQCITIVDALANYIINNPQNLQSAFDPIFTARLFVGTDPYLIHKVLQETRQIFVDAESRGIEVPQEIRLNSIPPEQRAFLVPQETRNMKLRIPPMTNRFTTPKIRAE